MLPMNNFTITMYGQGRQTMRGKREKISMIGFLLGARHTCGFELEFPHVHSRFTSRMSMNHFTGGS